MINEKKQGKTHFDYVCDRYRQMMKSIENKSDAEKRDRINAFRAGIL